MLNLYLKLGCVSLPVLLVGCMSTSLKQSLPAQQAMTQGYAQLYSVPNYQFSGQLKLDHLEVSPPLRANKNNAKDITGSRKRDKKNDSERSLLSDDADQVQKNKPSPKASRAFKDGELNDLIQRMIQTYGERYRFNYNGVVDLKNKQIELTPEFKYEARNMAGYVRVPMLVNFADAELYADLSALSPWLVNTDIEGKYTRFDWQQHQDKIDIKAVFGLIKDTALSNYQLSQAESFSDVALSRDEHAAGAVRKVQLAMPLSEYLANVVLYTSMNKPSFEQVFKRSKKAADKQAEAAQPTLLSAADIKARIAQDPKQYQSVLQMIEKKLDPASTFVQQALLDRHGRVIQSNWTMQLVSPSSSKYKVKLALKNQVNFSNYGRAKVSYHPNKDNWVDFKTSAEHTIFGKIFDEKGLKGLRDLGELGKAASSSMSAP